MATRTIGPIPLPEPGIAASGYFTFDDDLLRKYQWPYHAVVGRRQPGLTFLLTAGIHAAEYTGTLAALRLAQHLDPTSVSGTIVIVPLLNRPGFFERSIYVNPEDGQNLNRAFPGKADGTWSERFAHHVLNDLVLHVDRAMDLHAGDMIEALEPFLGYLETGKPDIDEKSKEMIEAYKDARWVTTVLPGGERAGMLYGAAAQHGVPAILAESGGCGLPIEADIQRHVDGVLNVWRTLGLLKDVAPVQTEKPKHIAANLWLRSDHEGIFLCRVKPGDRVSKGEALGEMVDLLGNHLTTIESPETGFILFTVTSPAIKKDGLLLAVAVPDER
jgi:predicted deacylase